MKFGLRYPERNGPLSKSAKFGDYIFNGLASSCRPDFGSGQMAGVKMYFDTRAPHIAQKSLKRSLAPGLLNSSTLCMCGVALPSKAATGAAGIDGTYRASCFHSLTQGTGRTELLSQHGKWENCFCGSPMASCSVPMAGVLVQRCLRQVPHAS